MKYRFKLIILGILCAGNVQGDSRPTLIRSEYLKLGPKGIRAANDYRRQHYTDIRPLTFFGLWLPMHKKVHASLKCVEAELKRECTGYEPKALSGWRPHNSYSGTEISNHVFGTAIDLDPTLNSCCGCKGRWSSSPLCKDAVDNLGQFDVTHCWVHVFESHDWNWLGNDPQLRDTMHFEYVGVPGAANCAG